MKPIDKNLLLDWLEEKRGKLKSANECGGCAVELLDEIIQNVRFMPQAVGFVHIENLVPVKWPEAGYDTRLRRLGEPKIAEYLEDLQAEMQTHEAMFLRLKELEQERMEFLKALDGNCDVCAHAEECLRGPGFCEENGGWKWGG